MALTILSWILKFVLPSVVVFLAVRMAVKAYMENEERKRMAKAGPDNSAIVLPIRLQAYERFILLLERMAPAQAINRALEPGMTSFGLQLVLVRNIREEFEHNAAQQLYISQDSWVMVKSAKEAVIHLINSSASQTEASSPSSELARIILERWSEMEHNPVQKAIDQLKSEVTGLL
ncbi:MAG TPA: hypothetical protein PLW31_09980 [Bacteroidales bacterium]|nr:hypothetical protein [Bacteroidales bacterium]HOX78360.1 hypothetical protein [Bacteroidales bacterium]HPI85082.1 hypothetical protein [Bacteroidales bacterium]